MTAVALQTNRTLWTSLVAFIDQAAAEYRAQRRVAAEQARIANELSFCNDRELGELGFSRCDIPNIANGTYAR
jgi:uncharacterized protein YjiS (DUF1127 family)